MQFRGSKDGSGDEKAKDKSSSGVKDSFVRGRDKVRGQKYSAPERKNQCTMRLSMEIRGFKSF